MKTAKSRKSFITLIISFLLLIALSIGGGYLLAPKTARKADAAAVTVGELMLPAYATSVGAKVNKTNFDTLIQSIANNSSATYDSLKTSLTGTATWTNQDNKNFTVPKNKTSREINGNAVLKVTFGGIVWVVTYVTTTGNDGNGDLIATLMTDAAQGTSRWNEGNAGKMAASPSITDTYNTTSKNAKYPYNMYSSSYVRVKVLNAGDPSGAATQYAPHTDFSDYDKLTTVSASERTGNQFAKFTLNNVANSLTSFIATPAQVRYQAIESWAYMDYVQVNSKTNCNLNNEAYETPTARDNWFMDNYLVTKTTAAIKNTDWKNDYLWLPSLTEVGSNAKKYNGNASDDGSRSGVWCTQSSVRSAISRYLSRTGGCGSYYNDMLNLTSTSWDTNDDVSSSVRPCLHLNLTKLYEATKDVEFKDVTDKVYNGDNQGITGESWYKAAIHGNTAMMTYSPKTVKDANEEGYTITFTLASGKTWSDGTTADKTINYKVAKRLASVTFPEAEGIPTAEYNGGIADSDQANPPDLIYTYYKKNDDNTYTQLDEAPSLVGDYKVSVSLDPAHPLSGNYKLKANETDPDPSTTFTIEKLTVTTPTASGGKSAPYTGGDIEFILENTAAIDSGKILELTDDDMPKDARYVNEGGVRKIIVKDVDTYKITFKLANDTQTVWGAGGGVLNLSVTPLTITPELNRESGSWQFEANTEQTFTITRGGFADDNVEYVITYTKPDSEVVTVGKNMISTEGLVTTVTLNGLGVGVHTLSVTLAAPSSSNRNKNYTINSPVTQIITVNGKTVTLTDADIIWKLTESETVALTDNMKVTYTGRIFTASIDTTNLSSKGVTVKSYSNQTGQNVGGVITTTVTLTKSDESYVFEDTTYTIHWEIVKAKYDLSKVEWSYTVPLVYNGTTQYVKLVNVPNGLTANITHNSGQNVMSDTAVINSFTNNNPNYENPLKNNASTYIYTDGQSFPWTCDWEITQAVININWDFTSATKENNGVEFAYPTLIGGEGKVTYKFYEADGTTEVALENIEAVAGVVKYYHVEAVLLESATQNYKFEEGVEPKTEFAIGQSKTAITVKPAGTAQDGVYVIGTYNGTEKPVDFTFSCLTTAHKITKEDFVLEYYDANGTKLDGAPTNAGNYKIRIVLASDDAAVMENYYVHGKSTFDVVIEKQKITVADIDWDYTDPFVYTRKDGSAVSFTVKLNGLPDELVTLGAVTYSGNVDFAVGTHSATATLDTSGLKNYEFVKTEKAESDLLTWSLSWKIEERKLNLPVSDKMGRLYDGATHDLAEICMLEEDWSEYMTVAVRKDSQEYDGTALGLASKTMIKNAGSYALVCTIRGELSGSVVWSDGNILDKSGFVTVNPREILVKGWKSKPSQPVFADENSATLCEVVYSLMGGEKPVEITKEQITQHYGELIRATLRVPESMAGNVIIKWDTNVETYDEFILFDPAEKPKGLEKPTLKEAQLAYKEEKGVALNQIFDVIGFDKKYMKVLGYSSITNAMTMGDVGKRTVQIALRGDQNVEWLGDDPDGIVELVIEITPAEITGEWGYDPTTKLPIFISDFSDKIKVEYFDKYGERIDLLNMEKGVTYAARAVLKNSQNSSNYRFADDLADEDEEGMSKAHAFVYGVVLDDNPEAPGKNPNDNTLSGLPLWQLIVGGVSALLFVFCTLKAFGEYGKYKNVKKETKQLATITYSFVAPLLAMGVGEKFLGLEETPWTIIALVAAGLFLISAVTLFVMTKKRKGAELALAREQARVAEEKELAKEEELMRREEEQRLREEKLRAEMREEQARRDNEMKMMFAAMQQGGFQQAPFQYQDMQNMIASAVSALLPAMQQQMALPPAQSDSNAYSASQSGYGMPNSEAEELRAMMVQQQAQMAQQQELLNQLLQNQVAQQNAPLYEEEEPVDDISWLGENDEVVSLEESYGALSDEEKKAYYDIGSYIMSKPRTSQNDGRYAVLFKYRGRTLFKLAIKDDAPVLYYPLNGGRGEVRIADPTSLETAKSMVDRSVSVIDRELN